MIVKFKEDWLDPHAVKGVNQDPWHRTCNHLFYRRRLVTYIPQVEFNFFEFKLTKSK